VRNLASATVLLVISACGSSASHSHHDASQDDAPFQADARPIDGPELADAMMADAPQPEGTHAHYVVDGILVPTTNAQAHTYALDLDGDAVVDNQLGQVLATLASMGFDDQLTTSVAVDRGDILMLADVQTTSFTTATSAGFTFYVGMNPQPTPCTSPADTVCRQHLNGTATFDVAQTPRDPELVGDFVSGTLTTSGGGHLPIQVAIGGGAPITLELVGARAKVTATSTSITAGIAAGGVSQGDLDTKVFPAVQATVMTQITAECTDLSSPPQCGCASGSTGATLIALFDANHDCAVSLTEITTNSLVQSLFAPDVMLEGKPAISLGLGFTAVPATYTP
jgi:hypothetical protein